jgi:ParB family chromosome partitioning protein
MTRPPVAAKTPPAALMEEEVDVESLVDNPRNSRLHPEEQIRQLMASLKARGQYKPVLARRANRMLIAGHGVRKAVARLGWPKIKVLLWDVDQTTADAAMLGDNKLAENSSNDDDRVAELLREIPETDWLVVGYTGDEVGKLLRDLDETEIDVREIETSRVQDTFWISIRGPLTIQAEVLRKLKLLMGEYRAVTVEMSTTPEEDL